MIDLKNFKIHGGRVEKALNGLDIIVNKNTLKGDLSAMRPSGMRLGSPAMTTRGLKEEHFDQIAEFFKRGVDLSLKFNKKKKMKDYTIAIEDALKNNKDFIGLKKDVNEFSNSFFYPNVEY